MGSRMGASPRLAYKSPQGLPASKNEPAVHVTWAEAQAFCARCGRQAADSRRVGELRHTTEQRESPTGEFETGKTYIYPVGDQPGGMNNNRKHQVETATTKQGVNGLYDMGGNVWEWLSDKRGEDALTAGGSWWYGPNATRVEGMQWKPSSFYAVYAGFRCSYE